MGKEQGLNHVAPPPVTYGYRRSTTRPTGLVWDTAFFCLSSRSYTLSSHCLAPINLEVWKPCSSFEWDSWNSDQNYKQFCEGHFCCLSKNLSCEVISSQITSKFTGEVVYYLTGHLGIVFWCHSGQLCRI